MAAWHRFEGKYDAHPYLHARPSSSAGRIERPDDRRDFRLGAEHCRLPGSTVVAAAERPSATLISSVPHEEPDFFNADARLLVHTMPSIAGTPTRATTLLFVPRGAPPAGGWPIVAWAHGTATPGQKTCAPSLSPDLDGGLTRDGFKSDYAFQIGQLVNAGYAVVAPDLEGLGPVATVPHPPNCARGAPVTYKTYPGADHFTVIRRTDADVLAFVAARFRP